MTELTSEALYVLGNCLFEICDKPNELLANILKLQNTRQYSRRINYCGSFIVILTKLYVNLLYKYTNTTFV